MIRNRWIKFIGLFFLAGFVVVPLVYIVGIALGDAVGCGELNPFVATLLVILFEIFVLAPFGFIGYRILVNGEINE